MSLFLDRLNLPVRNSDAAEKPDAMRSMQSNKCPGPVSLLNSLEKCQDKLFPVLLTVYKESLHHSTLRVHFSKSIQRHHCDKATLHRAT